MPVKLKGSSSGDITLDVPATAGTNTLTLPAQTANLITDSSDVLNIGSGQIYKDASGNVGIGTSSPSEKLTVATGSPDRIGIPFTNNAVSTLNFGSATNGEGNFQIQYNRATGALAFNGGATGSQVERMRIDSSGNVGIGTSSPGTKLEVVGGVSAQQITGRYFGFGTAGFSLDGTTVNDYGITYTQPSSPTSYNTVLAGYSSIKFATGQAERMRIDNSGNVMVGTQTAIGKVTISGSLSWTTGVTFSGANGANAVWATGFVSQAINVSLQTSNAIAGGQVFATSDIRLKENIEKIPTGLEFIRNVNPVRFNWKESGAADTGYIAQDLLAKGYGHLVSATPDEKMQEFVHEDGNVSPAGVKFVAKYDSAVPILHKAIQEQQTIIEQLQQRIAALEAKHA